MLTDVKCRTLIVEDDTDSSDALARLLRRVGHDVECASSAGEALVKLEEWEPDCVLLDLMLPDAPGGLVLRKIRNQHLTCRVAVVTAAHEKSRVLKHAVGFGPDAVFNKPIDFAKLKQWLTN
jgi:DNA-binding response OmpR family regulator